MAEQRKSGEEQRESEEDLQRGWDREGETRYPLDTMEEEQFDTDSEKEEWVENKLRGPWTPLPTTGRGARLHAARAESMVGRDRRKSYRRPDTSHDERIARELSAEPDTRGDARLAAEIHRGEADERDAEEIDRTSLEGTRPRPREILQQGTHASASPVQQGGSASAIHCQMLHSGAAQHAALHAASLRLSGARPLHWRLSRLSEKTLLVLPQAAGAGAVPALAVDSTSSDRCGSNVTTAKDYHQRTCDSGRERGPAGGELISIFAIPFFPPFFPGFSEESGWFRRSLFRFGRTGGPLDGRGPGQSVGRWVGQAVGRSDGRTP